MTNYTYNYTEEAFLLSSLHEMVKVWASGSGKARFNLDICDGLAKLQLNFQLGHPSEAHGDPYLPPNHEPPEQEVKQLFAPPQAAKPPSVQLSREKKTYKMKEEDLWSKLFTV